MSTIEQSDELERPSSLPKLIADKIMESIRDGQLLSGEKIVELQLAKRLNISRAPLREALKSLAAVGVVELRPNKGTYVSDFSIPKVEQLVVMRASIEGLAARIVASKMTPDMLLTLEKRLADINGASVKGDLVAWRELDWRFHEEVCVMSDNIYLLSSWRSISDLVRIFVNSHPGFVANATSILANHELMLQVLASGDPELAERTFRDIILTSGFKRLKRKVPPAFSTTAARKRPRT
jgi:DNA-binding GntR family transcriptional regulator